MRKLLIGVAAVAISMSVTACQKAEDTAANEAVVEEPMANEAVDANAAMDANAVTDANATMDANAVTEENAMETTGSTDHGN
jgi:hypothetical protein